jgi:undecaprenyl diphosphate synthase
MNKSNPTPPLKHLALIMDGNGRWAEARGEQRRAGHTRGAEVVRDVVRHAHQLGVAHLTLFAFSTLNWGRPSDEVAALMELLRSYLDDEERELINRRITLKVIGERGLLPSALRERVALAEERTATPTPHMTLTLAVSYDGRRDVVRAARHLVHLARRGELLPADVCEDSLIGALSTANAPEVDLLIRTSGERRLSGFLPLEACYAELIFLDKPWPEFTTGDLDDALKEFTQRQRRFGLTHAQLAHDHPELSSSPC